MKGQSIFVEHIFVVLFSMLILVSISALVYSFYRASLEREIRTELTQTMTQIKDSLIKLYDVGKNSKVQPSNFSSVLISEVDLNLPDNIAKMNYEVELITANSLFVYITNATISGSNISGGLNISGAKESSSAKIIGKTTQDPVVQVEFELPNLGINVQGKTRNGLDDALKFYRYNENTTVYDNVILGQSDIIIRITNVN